MILRKFRYRVGNSFWAQGELRSLPLSRFKVVLSGHEHNYQRSRPLKFAPKSLTGAHSLNTANRLVPGTFSVDKNFDGNKVTKPNGIIYLVTGAGGNSLYDPQMNKNPSTWTHPEDGNVAYMTQMISDRHSFTVVDVDSHSLLFTQIDELGKQIDQFKITKT